MQICAKPPFLLAMLAVLFLTPFTAIGFDDPVMEPVGVHMDFDGVGTSQPQQGFKIVTQFNAPDSVPGVSGNAWRTDGFSSWAEAELDLTGQDSFTAETWVALESYPSDLEVPVFDLSPSSFINQRSGNRGFDLYIDTYGRWGFRVATSKGRVEVKAPDLFPLYEWVHVAAVLDEDTKEASLFLNGKEVASQKLRAGSTFEAAEEPLLVARPRDEVEMLNFTVNRLNGAFDELTIMARASTKRDIRQSYERYAAALPDWTESLAVPESRFAHDHLRPLYHAMPLANWTNEPHGLTYVNDTWHIFFQRTPNGPFKTQMHWGHLKSKDLVHWEIMPDALRPELQTDDFGFDQKGIWSGDVIVDGGKAFAFYTSVNHSNSLEANNPGISMAVSEDADLRSWEKSGPILNTKFVKDFRDPYLFRSGGTWHMIIGAVMPQGHGGLDYYVLTPGENGASWEHQDDFSAVSFRDMDVGSLIWEMPVFEQLSADVWVLTVAPIGNKVSKYAEPAVRNYYWTGHWNGRQFVPIDSDPKPLDLLVGHVSPTVDRAEDGAIRAIGIVDERRSSQAQEDAGWAHTFSMPRRWFLLPDGKTLGQEPAPELAALRGECQKLVENYSLQKSILDIPNELHAYELEIVLRDSSEGFFDFDLLRSPGGEEVTRLSIDLSTGEIILDKSLSTLNVDDEEGPRVLQGHYDMDVFGPIETIRAYVDGSVVDVFINDAAAFSFRSYPSRNDSTNLVLSSSDSDVELSSVMLWPLVKPGVD